MGDIDAWTCVIFFKQRYHCAVLRKDFGKGWVHERVCTVQILCNELGRWCGYEIKPSITLLNKAVVANLSIITSAHSTIQFSRKEVRSLEVACPGRGRADHATWEGNVPKKESVSITHHDQPSHENEMVPNYRKGSDADRIHELEISFNY